MDRTKTEESDDFERIEESINESPSPDKSLMESTLLKSTLRFELKPEDIQRNTVRRMK